MAPIHESDSGVTFALRVHPHVRRKTPLPACSGGAEIVPDYTSDPGGRANEACIEFFATLLKVPPSSITIASGQTSRNKVIRVAGINADAVKQRLAS